MLLLVLVVAALSHMTEAIMYPTVTTLECNVLIYGRNYSVVYISVFENGLYLCFLGFKSASTPNLCVLNLYNKVNQTEFMKPLGFCRYYVVDTAGAMQFSLSFENTGSVLEESKMSSSTMVILEVGLTRKRAVELQYLQVGSLSLNGCTSASGEFVDPNTQACSGKTLVECSIFTGSSVLTELYECEGQCQQGKCVDAPALCSVVGFSVIDRFRIRHPIEDRCSYTLVSKDQVTLAAVFKDQRRRDVPLLDHLVLSVGPSKIRLGPRAVMQVDGSVVDISSALMPEGVTVSRSSNRVSLLVHNVFEMFFDGSSAVLQIINGSGVAGLCSGVTHVNEAKSTALSEEGCETRHQDPPDTSINCDLATQHCNSLSGPLFSSCHSHLEPLQFLNACKETLCRYPAVDGLDCAAHQAYATACSMFMHVTLPEWRNTTKCGSVGDLCLDTYCSDHEFCGVQMNEEKCLCRRVFASKYNHTLGEPAVCSHNSASLSLAVCLLAEKGIDYDKLHLNDATCRGEPDPQSHMLKFGFDSANMCGTEVTNENEQLVFKNKVMLQNHSSSIITREDQFELDFSCFYSQPQIKTVALKIKDSSVVLSIVSGVWSYNLTMKAYLDPDRTTPVTAETELQLDLPIWVELSTEGLDPNLVSIVTDACWATNHQLFNSTPRYDLVLNGCANPSDSSVEVHGNGVGTSNYFSFNTFEFTGPDSGVYLHCEVFLCVTEDQKCVPVCGGKRRRRSLYKDLNPGLISMPWTE